MPPILIKPKNLGALYRHYPSAIIQRLDATITDETMNDMIFYNNELFEKSLIHMINKTGGKVDVVVAGTLDANGGLPPDYNEDTWEEIDSFSIEEETNKKLLVTDPYLWVTVRMALASGESDTEVDIYIRAVNTVK